jgi:small subunit ribosomal protein S6
MARNYELTFIGKPDMDATNLAALIEKVKGFIAAESGTVVKLDQWGMRRLMYPIGKYKEGQYVFVTVQLEPAATARLENRLKLNEDIIRYLIVKAEDNRGKAAPKPTAEVSEPASVEPAVETTITVADPDAAE